jgi:hypothetical protein
MNAILMIQTQIMFDFVPGCGPDNTWPEQTISCSDWTEQRKLKDRLSVLTMAYHNLGS